MTATIPFGPAIVSTALLIATLVAGISILEWSMS